ncbi:MAG: hypothetical protein WCX85_02220 [Bacilli bacterium]|jgi:hypothetical protein|nr:hypothetical protein [Bacilli bacterium]
MNKFNKLLFSTLSLFALTVMTSCDGGGISIEAAVANERVMAAMEQMTTTEIESFEIDITADLDYSGKEYDDEDAILSERNLEAAGEINIKANDIFGDDAVGSIEASASVLAVEDDVTLVDAEASAALYLSEGWVYADITGAVDVIDLMGGEAPEITTIKTYVGNLGDAIGYDPEEPIVMPFEFDDMLPYANTISNIKATESNGELTVVYTITVEDIVNVIMKVMQDSGDIPAEVTSEQIATYHSELLAEISEIINITTAKLTIGVGADGFLSKLYVDIDVVVTIADEEEEEVQSLVLPGGHELHELAGFLHIDIDNMNQIVDVVLPDNLNTFTEIPTEEEPVT